MHCAANRFPDKVDKDPEDTRKLNVEATRNLAKLCAERDVFLIYISTDCMYLSSVSARPSRHVSGVGSLLSRCLATMSELVSQFH